MRAICFLAIAISVSFEARLERLGRRKGSGGWFGGSGVWDAAGLARRRRGLELAEGPS